MGKPHTHTHTHTHKTEYLKGKSLNLSLLKPNSENAISHFVNLPSQLNYIYICTDTRTKFLFVVDGKVKNIYLASCVKGFCKTKLKATINSLNFVVDHVTAFALQAKARQNTKIPSWILTCDPATSIKQIFPERGFDECSYVFHFN